MSLGKTEIKEDYQRPPVLTSDSSFPTTTPAMGDASIEFCFVFGSRNLDEQKCDQVCHDSSFRSVPNLPSPVTMQQLPRKDSVEADLPNSGEAYPVPKVKKDAQASVAPPANQTQKPSLLHMPMPSEQMPFHHQPHVSMQLGGPNPQIQSQSVSGSSIQMPTHMPLPMGNAPQFQRQVFVPGLQHHSLLRQGQGLSFTPPLGGQLAPQLGNLGMGIATQYPQQQGGKLGVPHKIGPVKITDPNTHEELRCDKTTYTYPDGGSLGPRSQKADAAGTTSDLYMAYKGPEEKKETVIPSARAKNAYLGVNLKQSTSKSNLASPDQQSAPVTTPDLYRSTSKYKGGNLGVLQCPRAQTPLPCIGGIFAAANYQQKGLIPSLQSPLQMMHKAKKKYQVGKVADWEDFKQRQLRGILNKLTPQNFEKLFEQVKAVNIDNAVTLTGLIIQIFDKALMEPTFCEMYANFCYHLAGELPDFSEENEKITLKRLLLNKCQEEFERRERKQEEANKVEEEGEAKQSEEEREEKRIKARRRMLGNIRLIGELYKTNMLTERIMHVCIIKLLGDYENPDEEDVEALCKLMNRIGEMIDHPKAKVYMDAYFERMAKLSNDMKLSSRVRFMLMDAIDLRMNKWQQKGLIPSLQSPLQTMHKAEKKCQVGKVADWEESKQRQLRGILNKLTPQNFEKLFEQVKAVNIDNAVTLTGLIIQIFDKALMEPTFCEMYANFCYHLAGELPDFSEDNEKITLKRLLLNKCQEEFERRERKQEEANKVEEEGEAKQSEEEREEKRIKARRRMLGNIRLIGELYKTNMLTERIMHVCIIKLLGDYENPDEEDVEALCKLMNRIGEMIDHPKAKVYMDAYFERMAKLSNDMKLSSRVRFMLMDAIDLRMNKWQQRRKVEGPSQSQGVYGCLL